MRKLLFALLFLTAWSAAQAQKIASSFKDAEGTPYAMQTLDAQYKNALHDDASLAVFTGAEQQRLTGAYQQLLQNLGKHLAQNGFTWGKPTRCFNRFYFKEDGTIDYYLFNFEAVDAQKQAEFQRLMTQFIQNSRIAIEASVKFSQCSPVVYKD